jgi:hypothetical protein
VVTQVDYEARGSALGGAYQAALAAPHFSIGQFVSKQSGGYPTYQVLRERLLEGSLGLYRGNRSPDSCMWTCGATPPDGVLELTGS